MTNGKWTLEKWAIVEEAGFSEPFFFLGFGSVENPGGYIDDLSEKDLLRLHNLLSEYFNPEGN